MSRLVYGIHPVEELLRRRAREVQALWVVESAPSSGVSPRLRALAGEAEAHRIPVTRTRAGELDALCDGASHQGVAAVVGEYAYLDLGQLLEASEGPPLLVVADSLMDPQNLGSIIRTALVLGATGLVLPSRRSVSITPAVVRVSAGASEHLPCARVTNLARALDELKRAGLWVAGAVERGGTHPADADLSGPLALVVGNEHKGIRPLVLEKCDLQLTLPSASAIASLNVAAATAALLYEIVRQRR